MCEEATSSKPELCQKKSTAEDIASPAEDTASPADDTASPADDTASPASSSKPCKRVSFNRVDVREYPVILGDHPSTIQGPPVTLDWKAQQTYQVDVDQYEIQPENRRVPVEFKMPAHVRHKLIENHHSQGEIRKAQIEARRCRDQRQFSTAMVEVEGIEIALASIKRKFHRWRRKRGNKEPEPAELWMERQSSSRRHTAPVSTTSVVANTRRNSRCFAQYLREDVTVHSEESLDDEQKPKVVIRRRDSAPPSLTSTRTPTSSPASRDQSTKPKKLVKQSSDEILNKKGEDETEQASDGEPLAKLSLETVSPVSDEKVSGETQDEPQPTKEQESVSELPAGPVSISKEVSKVESLMIAEPKLETATASSSSDEHEDCATALTDA